MPSIRYMVSYKPHGFLSPCGNWTFDTPEQAAAWASENRHKWSSFSFFWYETGSFIADLHLIDILIPKEE